MSFQVIAVAQVMNKQGATLNHAFTKEDEKVFMIIHYTGFPILYFLIPFCYAIYLSVR